MPPIRSLLGDTDPKIELYENAEAMHERTLEHTTLPNELLLSTEELIRDYSNEIVETDLGILCKLANTRTWMDMQDLVISISEQSLNKMKIADDPNRYAEVIRRLGIITEGMYLLGLNKIDKTEMKSSYEHNTKSADFFNSGYNQRNFIFYPGQHSTQIERIKVITRRLPIETAEARVHLWFNTGNEDYGISLDQGIKYADLLSEKPFTLGKFYYDLRLGGYQSDRDIFYGLDYLIYGMKRNRTHHFQMENPYPINYTEACDMYNDIFMDLAWHNANPQNRKYFANT